MKCDMEVACGKCGGARTVGKRCKPCRAKWKAAAYAANPEKDRARAAAWAAANPDKARAKVAAWKKAHPEQIRTRNAEWAAAHPERVRAARAAWAETFREKVRVSAAAWARRNRNRIQAWWLAHPEEMRAYRNVYNAKHPELRAQIKHRRRAREGVGGSWTAAEWLATKVALGFACIDCGMREGDNFPQTAAPSLAGKKMKLTVGHARPLFRGGSNHITNIIPQCAPCNFSQGTKLHPLVRFANP